MSSVLIMVQIILIQFLTIIIVDLTVPMFNFAGELKMLIRRTIRHILSHKNKILENQK